MLKSSERYGIYVQWLRGPRESKRAMWGRPRSHLNLGQRGSGKSTLLESCATRYSKIIDLFGARDNESLSWLRSPLKDSVVLVVGDSVNVKSCPCDAIKVSKLEISDFYQYDVILSCHGLYSDYNEEFQSMNEIVKLLWRRGSWQDPWFLMIREAANFLYSRIKIVKDQTIAKADFINLLREARHDGYAIGCDTIRWTSIDKEIRDVADYIWIKRVGTSGLPSDLNWLYSFVDPRALRNCSPGNFLLLCNRGGIGIGSFEEIPWHKQEGENLMHEFNIKVEYQEWTLEEPTNQQVGDHEHVTILEKYNEGHSQGQVAEGLDRSKATINKHIHDHNDNVKGKGYCSKCKRAGSKLAIKEIEIR